MKISLEAELSFLMCAENRNVYDLFSVNAEIDDVKIIVTVFSNSRNC